MKTAIAGLISRLWGIPWLRVGTLVLCLAMALYGAFLWLSGWQHRQKAAYLAQVAQVESQRDFYKAQVVGLKANLAALKLAYENQATHRDFDCDGVATIENLPDGRTLIRCEGKAHDTSAQGPVLPPPIQPPTQATPSPCPEVVGVGSTEARPWRIGVTGGLYDWKHPVFAGSLGYDWKRIWVLAQVGPKLGTATIGVKF